MSRMYLGMHSLGDVLAGVLLSAVILPPVVTFVHLTDTYLVTDPWSPVTTLLLSITAIIIFPCAQWSASAATAVDVLGCYQGVILGQWGLHCLGHVSIIHHHSLSMAIPAPDMGDILMMMLRVIIGGSIAGLFRILIKPVTIQLATAIIKPDSSLKYSTPLIISKVKNAFLIKHSSLIYLHFITVHYMDECLFLCDILVSFDIQYSGHSTRIILCRK